MEPALLEKMTWLTGLHDLNNVIGAFISNELVDAMPVHIILYRDDDWSELWVDISGEDFCFVPAKDRGAGTGSSHLKKFQCLLRHRTEPK